jgi:poly-gamma-glutamate system protein
MKGIYWRPKGISIRAMTLVALLAVGAVAIVEHFKKDIRQNYYGEKLAAAELAADGMDAIKHYRLERGDPIDPTLDPAVTGMLGLPHTPVTTNAGGYFTKRTSLNPNFAAVAVDMLKDAGVKSGDSVALGVSGSYPAVNLAVYAACQVLNLKPVIIASASSSEWGANNPDLLWLDMERILNERGILKSRAAAASLGGIEDVAKGLPPASLEFLRSGIQRNGVEKFLEPANYADSVKQRLEIYREKADGPIAAYINVGGGTSSAGRAIAKETFRQGLNMSPPRGADTNTSVMAAYSEKGTPVIHLLHLMEIADEYGLPRYPSVTPIPGEGGVFHRLSYNRLLAAALLILVIAALYGFVRSPWGAQFLRNTKGQKDSGDVEPMI